MTPERWQQVKQIFQSAIERPASERDGFISQACADDPDLRSQMAGRSNDGGVWQMQQFARGSTDLRESEWSSNGPVRMAGLSKELVSNAMYSDDVLRFRRVLLDLLT